MRQYVVEFTDGTTENYFANVIAEKIYTRIDKEGHQYLLVKEIIDHEKSNHAVSIADVYIVTKNGKKILTRFEIISGMEMRWTRVDRAERFEIMIPRQSGGICSQQ